MRAVKFQTKFYIAFLLLLIPLFVIAQAPKRWTSGEIHEGIKKLNFLGSALYLAAHPDDENTRMIAYLANEKKAKTGYLSMTRGDGGQNLIGPEIRELLGVIRTQELLAARRTDGGTQMFTRANDFGYSKNPNETFNIWDKEKVMADVVWALRKWKPDIIVNRFDHRTPGRTHGHHTGSAMLATEAFDLAADKNAFPEQLQYLDTWQPTRLFFNTGWFFYGSRANFEKADKTNLQAVDVGVYYPNIGKSNTEIAAEARSMHKCQGFGSSGSRGSSNDYVEFIKGVKPNSKDDLFAGINTTWSRVDGGAPITKLVDKIEQDFEHDNPSAIVPQLVAVYAKIAALPDGYWKKVKLEETQQLIEATMGLFLEAIADDYSITPGEDIEIGMEMINRSGASAKLTGISILPLKVDTSLDIKLSDNLDKKLFKTVSIPDNFPYSNAYWLNEEAELGMYTVKDQLLRGLPETPRPLKVAFDLNIYGQDFTFVKDVVFKRTDPVAGEVYRPFEVIPPVYVSVPEPVYVFAQQDPQEIKVVVTAGKPKVKGQVKLDLPKGWKSEPLNQAFDLKLKGEETSLSFKLYPPRGQSEGQLTPVVDLGDRESYNKELVLIEYDHIPTQSIFRKAKAKIVKVDIKKKGERIAYIMGAGDAIPQSLEQIGYQVDILEEKDITDENLKKYDALIIGIRAYNTKPAMRFLQPKLMGYVEQGGTMIVQYNTTRGLKVPNEELGPYPLKLSRDRVAVEEAEVRILAPDHEVLNAPNKITSKDFEGWVQERGLYFPNEWDPAYTPILSSNDPGEDPKDGGLLVASYGKGYYIYSGYSWFRELPAGVPGAYRLFANMISIGK